MTRAYQLLRILQSYAPTLQDQYLVSQIYNRMQWDLKLTETEIEKNLICALAEGINHGNWPWVVSKLTTDQSSNV